MHEYVGRERSAKKSRVFDLIAGMGAITPF